MGRRRLAWSVLTLMLACWALASACSGVRPIKKGETVRCPSCGVEFKIEEGMKP